ncbi:26S proteasome-associated Mov34/MPN/PAD1-like and JAB domain-containing protein [Cryptosporidium canis]|uniref:1,4-alpha-glucan branching enzyme n=1 Tax=Cryptosporidium canis TaxID=195482 RepID=A0ABQ8P5R0_9CRYT|nr:26S proteasome-associated Mov34/MPN/PAD1-like and JAB domain-containing protein [Cryptosporidium canis]
MSTRGVLQKYNMKSLKEQKSGATILGKQKAEHKVKGSSEFIGEVLIKSKSIASPAQSLEKSDSVSVSSRDNSGIESGIPTAANSPTSYSSSMASIPDERGDVYEALERVPEDGRILDHDLHLLSKAIHPEPFGVLGYHKFGDDGKYEYYVVRAWVRNAKRIRIKALDCSFSCIGSDNTPVEMEQRYVDGGPSWMFEKAFRTLKDRIPVSRVHFCGYGEGLESPGVEDGRIKSQDDALGSSTERISDHGSEEMKKNKENIIISGKLRAGNNSGKSVVGLTPSEGSSKPRPISLSPVSSGIPRMKKDIRNDTCSSDEACNCYVHDNVNSEECIRKLYYELLVEYIGDQSEQVFAIRDTYSFGVLLSDHEMELFQSGSCWHVDNILGSHIIEYNGVKGVRFTVWAPHAKYVRVVGDWNSWDGRVNPMRLRHGVGIWELFIPHLGAGEKYGYEIHSQTNDVFVKIDPYSQEYEIPPRYASIISSCDDSFKDGPDRFSWDDQSWMKRREDLGLSGEMRRQPMSIYEVHLPSWMRRENGDYLGYREIAERLVEHVKNLNFTHVEFLPLAQHPFEGSWGYQVTGQYAPYSRLGSPDDFKYLVNELHKANIGVFMDFVPAHFCKDSWGLVYYDGTPTYEYGDPREGEHKQWGTAVFNYRRNEVRSFLLGAAYHWLRRYHIDGLRIDAVSSMLYRNYLRPNGEWIPNEFGGDANLEAVSLLQELNWVIHKEFPGVFTMAEESTAWQGVTHKDGGLGFDAKWDLGWMNDTLSYLYTPPDKKSSKHNKLTFRGLYMSHENWVLPLSHDEVVNGKGSLLDKCGFTGAPYMDRIRTLKALFGYQVGMPGRPLLFQGAEIAQGREWKENRSVDWHEGEEDVRKKVCIFLSDLLAIYKDNVSLHAGDDESWNFQWVDCENSQDCIVAFLRKYKEWYNDVVVVCNFSSRRYNHYPIGVAHGREWVVMLNSDDWKYGGAMFGPGNHSVVHASHGGRVGWDYCIWMDIPEFSCIYLKPKFSPEEVQSTSLV